MKFCLGEIVTTKAEFRKLADEALEGYDLVELWLDYILDWDLEFIQEVSQKYADQLLILTRRNDQQAFSLSLGERLAVLEEASRTNVFIDLDFLEQKEELEFFSNLAAKSKLILSYHNYKVTPDYQGLEEILLAMLQVPAEFYKLACYCNSRSDLLNLLKIKEQYSTSTNQLIVLGAGADGLLSRFACVLDRQAIIYAPRSLNKAVINGQLSLQQYNLFQEMLNAG